MLKYFSLLWNSFIVFFCSFFQNRFVSQHCKFIHYLFCKIFCYSQKKFNFLLHLLLKQEQSNFLTNNIKAEICKLTLDRSWVNKSSFGLFTTCRMNKQFYFSCLLFLVLLLEYQTYHLQTSWPGCLLLKQLSKKSLFKPVWSLRHYSNSLQKDKW